jgi:hypothetical protein
MEERGGIMDKRLKNSEPALLWDYRRAKTLLDVLALPYGEREDAIHFLAVSWETPIYYAHGKMLIDETIHHLAKHCLQSGKDNVAERQAE